MVNTDRYYNLPAKWGDYAQTDEALRLRSTVLYTPDTHQKIKETNDVTYKGPKIDPIVFICSSRYGNSSGTYVGLSASRSRKIGSPSMNLSNNLSSLGGFANCSVLPA